MSQAPCGLRKQQMLSETETESRRRGKACKYLHFLIHRVPQNKVCILFLGRQNEKIPGVATSKIAEERMA